MLSDRISALKWNEESITKTRFQVGCHIYKISSWCNINASNKNAFKPHMHSFSAVFALISTVAGSILVRSGSGTTAGSPSQPFIFIDVGGDETSRFLTAVPVGNGEFAPALIEDFTQASNAYLNNSVFLVQPANTTAYLAIQTLTTQGPTPAPKGLNSVALTSSQGTTGFFVSSANDDVFSTNKNFGFFYHCAGFTVGTLGLPQVFWATPTAKIPAGCIITQFETRVR